MSDSSRPHGLQPTRLLCPWDFQARVLEWVSKSLQVAKFDYFFSPVSMSPPHIGIKMHLFLLLICLVSILLLGWPQELKRGRGRNRQLPDSSFFPNIFKDKNSKGSEWTRDFPGGPETQIPDFHCRGHGIDHWVGN